MEQTYTPKLNVPAIRGWCGKYVDDAGNAPFRSATAMLMFVTEKNAGRIRTDLMPENIWLVGWLDFTTGAYKEYGHVYFIKRTGNSYEIHDSEVHAGARGVYRSIDELIAWFGAYKPKYIGWSTNCDGRQYAKEKGDDMIPTRDLLRSLIYNYTGEFPNEDEYRAYVGKISYNDLIPLLDSGEPHQRKEALLEAAKAKKTTKAQVVQYLADNLK